MTMEPSSWPRISSLFEEALDQPAERRAAFLGAACGDDKELLQSVASLLRNHDRASAFLEAPAAIAADLDGFRTALSGKVVVGRYRLEEELGSGGFGVVYLASDLRLSGKKMAIKLMHEHWLRSTLMRARFKREVQALSRIQHPGVVLITDFGETEDSQVFLAMELVEGRTVRSMLEEGRLPLAQAADIVSQTASALEAIHRRDILHLDLKPENIMVTECGLVKIVDFGIARIIDPKPGSTLTTLMTGTPDYMAPEALMGRASRSSDVYSLAVIAYEMVTGQRPFHGANLGDLIERQRKAPAQPLKKLRPDLPARAERLIRRELAHEERDRPPGAGAFGEALADALVSEDSPVDRIGRRAILVGAGASALAGAGAWSLGGFLAPPAVPTGERIVEWSGTRDLKVAGFASHGEVEARPELNEDRSSIDRIHVFSKGEGAYCHPLTRAQRSQAWNKGWKLSFRFSNEEGDTWAEVDLAGFGPRFRVAAARSASQQVICGLVRELSSDPDSRLAGHNIPEGPRLTLVELVFSPSTRTATLFTNGARTAEGYSGLSEAQAGRGAGFGVSKYLGTPGSGLFQLFRFEIFT